ncbi:hypothetical protein ACH5RR_006648 [Cinchona calisaya]|uniref:Uncharacterized protein n=1 Tax=Cinchona calisaya TaxID=153742 RepID=A0ABD3APW5_9GENT
MNIVSVIKPSWLTEVTGSYEGDENIKETLVSLAIQPDSIPDYTYQLGIMDYLDNKEVEEQPPDLSYDIEEENIRTLLESQFKTSDEFMRVARDYNSKQVILSGAKYASETKECGLELILAGGLEYINMHALNGSMLE